MNLVKWLRKNNKKIMAIVVIVIMFGFVGGAYIRQLGQRRTGLHKTVAYFADNRKITNYDLALARRELETLKMLRANTLLKSIPIRMLATRTLDLRTLLLGELLFSERTTSPASIRYIKRIIGVNRYAISNEQINDIYNRSMGNEIYWLLLKNEARLAGVRISNEYSGRQLGKVIPDLFEGATYSQLIGALINQQRIAEKEILSTFAKLLAVLEYGTTICTSEDVTTSQIMHNVSWKVETVDVELVKFDSSMFAETQDQPDEEKMSEHFEKYKTSFAGDISKENPYGFGYKLPDRVQLEYIAVKLDDISAIVTKPTNEEVEQYHDRYREEFTELVPSDPNDPNSPPIERAKSYAEVAGIISKLLLQKKINSKANMILQEAKTLTEAALEDTEPQNLTSDQLRQMAGDYNDTADQLSKKHQTKIYAGKTGLLSAADVRTDEYLGRLYVEGYGHNPPELFNLVGLPEIIFSIDELGSSELGPFDTSKPKMYENIGPLKDTLGKITAVMRVREVEKASAPESINQTYSKSTLRLGQDPNQTNDEDPNRDKERSGTQDVYSVKEKVAEDLKKLAAMETAKSKTREFIKQVVKDGWEDAIDKFNQLYGQDKKDEGDPNVFTLQKMTNIGRIPRQTMVAWTVQMEGNPTGYASVNEAQKNAEFVDRLYSLVPQDSNTLDAVPFIMEFKPDMSYYCLKNLSVKRLARDEYEKIKPLQVYEDDLIQSQSLAAVHFNPENILKRMNFRLAREEVPEDANEPTESKGT
jgi:hypothetical protein